MKRILFFINTLNGGGAEKVLVDLLNVLDSKKYYIDLVTVTGGIHEKRLPAWVNYRKIIKTNNKNLIKIFTKVFYHLPFGIVNKIIKKDSYDIEIAYLEGFPTRVIAAGNSNAKKIAFIHCDVSVNNVLDNFYKNKEECIKEYNKFDKVCLVSDMAKLGFEKSVGCLDNSIILHNVIDFDNAKRLSVEPSDFEYSTSGMKLIAVGRLSEEKGVVRLVEVLTELEKQYDFEMWIVGDGTQRAEIERIIKQSDSHSIKLLGYQTNPYVLLKKADLFICPSFYEGYSTVTAEAVSLGIPVLTTDCAGMDEILENRSLGLVVENSKDGLKNGLITIMKDQDYYNQIKLNVKEKEKNTTSHTAVKKYDELFEELLQ